MYLLDANVLIQADAEYYPLDRFPQFWKWIADRGRNDVLKIPREIYDEIVAGRGVLVDWLKQSDVKSALVLEEQPDPTLVRRCLEIGYQSNDPKFDADDIAAIGRDAFLVAYGMADSTRIIVTKEVSKKSWRRGRTKVPDACDDCRVRWTTDFEMYRILNFHIRP